ncbi:MAG: response receiver-modulated diguanylate cyclase [Candidatus Krumholzibacteriota bacterium]|nr:response receiver-modulated diguanylate cyclase [Candidatus Krumholzibacteriota bacterium]
MARIFEKDYKYLLTNLVPLHRLSVQRRRHVKTAIAGGDPAEMRVVALLALEDLYESRYFDRARTHEENGHVVVTYVKNDGSYQIRLAVPNGEWEGMEGRIRREDRGGGIAAAEEVVVIGPQPVETTIDILPDIIRSFAIDGRRESTLRRLDSVLKFMPDWFRFTSARLYVVEERLAARDEDGEFVTAEREKTLNEKVVYQTCRHSKQTAVFDLASAKSAGFSPPPAVATRALATRAASMAVSPIFYQDDFWGILEVWSAGDDDGPLFRDRVDIASGMIGQMVENTIQLENLTSIDWLTGLYNRQFYDRMVRIEIERATRSGSRLSLLVLDLDSFKVINDTLGHRKGDEALVVVADLLRENLRKIDLAFRYGGEEFVILLPGTGEVEAIHTAERLRAVISEYQEFLDDHRASQRITVSIGGAVFPEDARTEDELFRRADGALLVAKRKGKNRVEFFHE